MIRQISRLRCLQYVALFASVQVLFTFAAIWMFNGHQGSSGALREDKDITRLLLSVTETRSSSNRIKDENHDDVSKAIEESEFAAQFDKYRMFKTKFFFSRGSEWNALSERRHVCLGAQSSIDRVHWLLQTLKSWSGPISIALFTPDIEFHISFKYINYLRKCFPKLRGQVSFHITFPVNHSLKKSEKLDEVVGDMSCEDPKDVLQELLKYRTKEMMSWRESMKYPQNLLRNVAKQGCQTNYTFIPDIDMIPIPNMDLELEKFLASDSVKKCDKCAFVIPTFEIDASVDHMPVNKSELVQFVKKKKARQFHKVVYNVNQQSSNLEKWLTVPMAPKVAVAYKVEHYIFRYEPLYVAKADTPLFDERFIGFGMTRNTQVYEMYVAGYEFILLNNLFTNHWGFQTIKTRPAWRAKQQEENNHKFDDFAKEIKERYGGRDPYKMMTKLKSLNLKGMKVGYGKRT